MKNIIWFGLFLLYCINTINGQEKYKDSLYTVMYGNYVQSNIPITSMSYFKESHFKGSLDKGQDVGVTLFSQNLWMGGFDEGKNLNIAKGLNNYNNYRSGPILKGKNIASDEQHWMHVWQVRRYAVESLLADYAFDQKIDFKPDDQLLRWPGRGNPYFESFYGFALPDQDLAPFVDIDNDGKYDPYKGDYPVADPNYKTKIADDLCWNVFNDNNCYNPTDCYGNFEIQATSYSFYVPNKYAINHTIYTDYKIYNKSNEPLDSFYVGQYSDIDIDCPSDDYFGCSPEKNAFYGYNSVENTASCSQPVLFKERPPVHLLSFVNMPLSSFISVPPTINFGNEEPVIEVPFYRFLTGSWLDGTPIKASGDGYFSNAPSTTFLFFDPPSKVGGWSMAGNIPPKDLMVLGSTKIGKFPKDSYTHVVVANTFFRQDAPNVASQVDSALAGVDELTEFVKNGFSPYNDNFKKCKFCLWPGDSDYNGMVNNLDYLRVWNKQNNNGLPRDHVYSAWVPLAADDWSLVNDGLNHKYSDCNGDGMVDVKDVEVVGDNLLEKNDSYQYWGGSNQEGEQLVFEKPNLPIFGTKDTVEAGDVYGVRFYLDGINQNIDLSSIGYSIQYDTAIFELANQGFVLLNKWNSNTLAIENKIVNTNGRYNIASHLLDNSSILVNNKMELGRLFLKVKQSYHSKLPTDTSYIKFANFRALNTAGDTIIIGTAVQKLFVKGKITSVIDPNLEENIIAVYPIPASNILKINSKLALDYIEIIDSQGKLVMKQSRDFNTINVSNLADGIYFIKCESKDKRLFYKKIMVLH